MYLGNLNKIKARLRSHPPIVELNIILGELDFMLEEINGNKRESGDLKKLIEKRIHELEGTIPASPENNPENNEEEITSVYRQYDRERVSELVQKLRKINNVWLLRKIWLDVSGFYLEWDDAQESIELLHRHVLAEIAQRQKMGERDV
jgi:hypothetical protein